LPSPHVTGNGNHAVTQPNARTTGHAKMASQQCNGIRAPTPSISTTLANASAAI
jgi:hypothetical protein